MTREDCRVSARGDGSAIVHISACTWWSHTTVGTRDHTGLRNGIPFQISTSPSSGPNLPDASSIGPLTNTA